MSAFTTMNAPTLITATHLVSVFKTMTAEERMEVRKALGIEETGAKPQAAAADAKPKKAGRPKVAPAPVSLPVAVAGNDEEAPEADAYRLSPEEIREDLCQGRRLSPDTQDKRWKPSVYREVQCSGKPAAGSELCATCAKRQERYAEDDSPKANWHGRISDEPFGWAHMLGTTWAEEKKPKWLGSAAPSASASVVADDSDAASEVSDPAPAAAGAGSAKANKAAEKEAAKAAKEAEKAAAKAAKEAEKAAAKAAKEAEKAAAKAAKEAEKEAKKAEKPAAKKPAAAKQVPAKADTGAEVAETAGSMSIIDGTEYWVLPNGNVYDYDSATEKGGDFVGRLTEDGSLDSDAEELTE